VKASWRYWRGAAVTTEPAPIPVVDIGALFDGSASAVAATAQALGSAARANGFLYVTGHRRPAVLFEQLLTAARDFFAQPLAEKMRVYIGNSRNHRGYVPQGEEVFAAGTKDVKEAYDCSRDLPQDDPDYLAGNPLLGPNQWPELPGFKHAVSAYYDATFELGRVLLRGFALALGEPPERFDPMLTKPPSQLRLIHYPHDAGAEDQPGIGAHTDYELFTLLRSTGPGLEIMNESGAWMNAPPVPHAYVVNIGDMLELWSNGEFVATSHRVRKVPQERYSFPLFFAVDYHTRITPMPRRGRQDRPAAAGLIAGEHLYAQTARTFNYLRTRLASGELTLPQGSLTPPAFGRRPGGEEKLIKI
jgi:isopenicillin N synthase-like dioxygenase